jgi:Leucine Rich repeat
VKRLRSSYVISSCLFCHSRADWQGRIKTVKTLDLCYASVRDSHVRQLSHLPALEDLNLDSCPIGDASIAHLAERNVVPNLTCLDLADTDVTDIGMSHIAKFSRLAKLSLFYCNITNASLEHVAKLESLETLNLDSREISNEGLIHLTKLRRLKHLDVFSARISDTGCGHLAKITSLESLELCGGGVGDLGCALIATLENLTSLNLSQNERVTNRGAAALAVLTNLRALNLSNTRVNSSALPLFSGLFQLQSLALYGCTGIDQGDVNLHRLQNGLPNLKCVRLHSASDDDGKMIQVGADSDDDEADDCDDRSCGGHSDSYEDIGGPMVTEGDEEIDLDDDVDHASNEEASAASHMDRNHDISSVGSLPSDMDHTTDDNGGSAFDDPLVQDVDDEDFYSDHE